MAVFTMFTNALIHILEDRVADIEHSSATLAAMNNDDRDDTLYFETDRFLLNQNEQRNIVLPNFSASEWITINLKVNGEVRLDVLEQDYNSPGVIRSISRVYGDNRFPGILELSTYNVLEIKIIGIAEFSSVESYAAVIVPPTDGRLLTNQ